MAEVTVDPSAILQILKSGGGIAEITELLGKCGKATAAVVQNMAELSDEVKASIVAATNFDGSLGSLKSVISGVGEDFLLMGAKLALISPLLDKRFPMADELKKIASSASDASASLMDVTKSSLAAAGIDPSKNELGAWLTSLSTKSDFAKGMEDSLLRAAGASGQLGTYLQSINGDFSRLSEKTEQFSSLTFNVGNAVNMTGAQVGKYAMELMKVPGAMDLTVGSADSAIQPMSMLEAVMKTSAGTFQSTEEVIKDVSFAYMTLGTSGEKSLEFVSRMRAASDALHLPLEIVKSLTKETASSFKFLGDNTQGAIDIINRLSPALRESGFGPEAIKEVVKGVAEGIAGMGTAQKAFLAAQSGLGGGLQGAFKIDLMLKEGKLAEVEQMVMTSMKKQIGGGPIVDLKQASESEGAAAQYQKQLAMLTSGPTAIAKTEDQAKALIEALAKGEGIKPEDLVKSSKDAFSDTMKNSEQILERNQNALININNASERVASLSAITARNTSIQLLGSEGPLAPFLKELSTRGSTEARGQKLVGGVGIEGGKDINTAMRELASGLMNDVSALVEGAKNAANEFTSRGGKKPEAERETEMGAGGIEPFVEEPEVAPTAGPASPTARVAKEIPKRRREEEEEEGAPPGRMAQKKESHVKHTFELQPFCAGCQSKLVDQKRVFQIVGDQIEQSETAGQQVQSVSSDRIGF